MSNEIKDFTIQNYLDYLAIKKLMGSQCIFF